MTTIRGLLTYVPTSSDQRVAPIAPATGSDDRPPRRDMARLSLVPTRSELPAVSAGLDAAAIFTLSSLPRRRGLKAETSERSRYARAYARPSDAIAPPPLQERRA